MKAASAGSLLALATRATIKQEFANAVPVYDPTGDIFYGTISGTTKWVR